jgi:outer membrane protein OmpA-like peptidoglycan-associated protein
VDIYGGYGYIRPFSSFSKIGGYEFQPVGNPNATVSITDYLWKNLGFQLEGSYFNGGGYGAFHQCAAISCSPDGPDPMYYTLGLGPVLRFPKGRYVPFVHLTFGPAKVNGPYLQPLTWGEQATAGGGTDYVLPYWKNRLAVRGQVDFVGMHVSYGGPASDTHSSGVADIVAWKVSGGLVLRLGAEMPPAPVGLACSVVPASIYPGDPLTVTGTATGLDPKKKASYTYTSTGGAVAPSGETATIATTGLSAGTYTVSGTVSEGQKPRENATCSASFAVKPFEPPTLSCSANPPTLMAGDTATITASGMSPQNRPLTYSYTASAGQISGSGSSVTLATAGVAPATILVGCSVTDDLGQKASASTSVTISTPPSAPAKPEASILCSILFERDKKRPTRVDNEGKACLDDLALALQRSTDATLDLVGNANTSEKDATKMAAERAVNTKDYLVKEKGIDATRIVVFTGNEDAKSVTTTLVPAGATPVAATAVDETVIKPIPRKPLGMKKQKK